MPSRTTPLITGEIYHVLNRSVASIPIFEKKREYARFLLSLKYYRYTDIPGSLSHFLRIKKEQREAIMHQLSQKSKLRVSIICFCIMPNHFHLLLKQEEEGGISEFVRLIANSYSKYFNIKHQRSGPVFENRFRAVRVETEAQFLHLSRYIHLNPYSGFLVKTIKELLDYRYSSLREYLGLKQRDCICQKNLILSHFSSVKKYQKFLQDRADYQRNLEIIKRQLLE